MPSPSRLTTAALGSIAAALVGWVLVPTSTQAAPRPITFAHDVAPIVYDHCVPCHRPGEAAPFSLLTFEDARQRARLIVEVTENHVMPPWQPDSESGEFEGDRRLDPRQIETMRRWVEDGAQEGDPAELPDLPRMTAGWRLGTPDLVVSMEDPFQVPAAGGDVFRNFVLPVHIGERKYVRAIEFRPGNARVLHHARILLDDTGEIRRLDARDDAPGFSGMDVPGARFPDGHFLGWAPGKMPDTEAFPWPIEPGSDFVVQMHLKPTGRAEVVQASIGLYLTDKPPSATPLMIRLGSKTIDIPAGEAQHQVVDSYVLPVDVTVRSVYPHAHYLAKEMTVTARKSDGSVETLLHIPNWNFNWQDEYEYRRPVALKKGTTIQMRYTYDNSGANPHNPSLPPKRVRFGSDTTDEMGELLVQVLPKRPADAGTIRADVTRKNLMTDVAGEEKRLRDNPNDHETRNALGVSYVQLGRQAEALKQFQDAVRIAPAYPLAHYNLALIALAEQRFAAAASHLQQALAARPDYAEARNNLGVLYEATGRPDLAVEQYRLALDSRPMHSAAHNNIARMLLSQGQTADALAHLQSSLRARPDNTDALYLLGRVQVVLDQPRDAVLAWRRLIALRPESVPVLIDLAWLLAGESEVQNAPEAVKLAERANKLTNNANPAVLDLLSASYAADGRLDIARRVGSRALMRALAIRDDRLAAAIRRRLDGLERPDGDVEIP